MLHRTSSIEHNSQQQTIATVSWLDIFVDLSFGLSMASLGDIFSDTISWSKLGNYTVILFIILWAWNRISWHSAFNSIAPFGRWIIYAITIFAVLAIATNTSFLTKGDYKFATYWFLVIDTTFLILWSTMLRQKTRLQINTLPNFLSYFVSFWLVFISLFVKYEAKVVLWIISGFVLAVIPYIGWLLDRKKVSARSASVVSRQFLFATFSIGLSLFPILSYLREIFNFTEIGLAALSLFIVVMLVRLVHNNIIEYRLSQQSVYNSFKYVYALNLLYLPLMGALAAMVHGYINLIQFSASEEPLNRLYPMMMMVGLGAFIAILGILPQAFLKDSQNIRTIVRIVFGFILITAPFVASSITISSSIIIVSILLFILALIEYFIGKLFGVTPSVGPVIDN